VEMVENDLTGEIRWYGNSDRSWTRIFADTSVIDSVRPLIVPFIWPPYRDKQPSPETEICDIG